MNIGLIANFFNTFLNNCVRDIPAGVRWVIVIVSAIAMFWFFALSINKDKKDKPVLKIGYLILSFIFLGILILYCSFHP